MKRKKIALLVVLVFILAGITYGIYWFRHHGFSARAQPSWLEAYFARNARRIATPGDAKSMQNPYPQTDASLAEAREHFVEHCSICHDIDGRGQTMIGRNLYPKAPDMTNAETQRLTDGELFYIISNGVRFTGMPAWSEEDSPESIWALVSFIRRLPKLSPEDLKQMREMASGRHEEAEQTGQAPDAAGRNPAKQPAGKNQNEKPKPHSHQSGAGPHKH